MSWEHAQRMARVREKEAHPEKFCWHKRCLKDRQRCGEHGPAERESWIRGYAACAALTAGVLETPEAIRRLAESVWDTITSTAKPPAFDARQAHCTCPNLAKEADFDCPIHGR